MSRVPISGEPQIVEVWQQQLHLRVSALVGSVGFGIGAGASAAFAMGTKGSGGPSLLLNWQLLAGCGVAVFVMVDSAVKQAFPYVPVSLRDTFIAYLSINEAFSCIDHLAFFGMPVPEAFLKRLRKYRDECLAGRWAGPERRRSMDEDKGL